MKSCALWVVAAATAVSAVPARSQEAGIVVSEVILPAPGAAYHGGTHVFLNGGARLTCSSHGGFTSSVAPPRTAGTTAIADYRATFTGELALEPPAVSSPAVFPIAQQVHMVERIALGERRGREQVLETEIVALDLQGPGLPNGVLVRESPELVSSGRTSIAPLEGGRFRVESYYDVWLEISLDGGRSWNRAEAAVRMSIAPAARAARISPGGGEEEMVTDRATGTFDVKLEP